MTTGTTDSRNRNKRIQGLSVSAQIQESLRERIINLELEPGQCLSRNQISDYYGVSLTPVRDAMMRLEEEGLLLIRPQSKTEVTKIDVSHAEETQVLRLSLELEASRRIIDRNDPSLLSEARKILEQQKASVKDNHFGEISQLDKSFHRSLFISAGIEGLWELVIGRSGHIDRLRNLNLPDPGKAAEILVLHEQILDAMEATDVQLTERRIRLHLGGTLASIDSISAKHPEYF